MIAEKFKDWRELFSWLSQGKPVRCEIGGLPRIVYPDNKGAYGISFSSDLSFYRKMVRGERKPFYLPYFKRKAGRFQDNPPVDIIRHTYLVSEEGKFTGGQPAFFQNQQGTPAIEDIIKWGSPVATMEVDENGVADLSTIKF